MFRTDFRPKMTLTCVLFLENVAHAWRSICPGHSVFRWGSRQLQAAGYYMNVPGLLFLVIIERKNPPNPYITG